MHNTGWRAEMATGSNVHACAHVDTDLTGCASCQTAPWKTKQLNQTLAHHRAAASSAPAREAQDNALAYPISAVSQMKVLMAKMLKLFYHKCPNHKQHTMKKMLYSVHQYAKSRRPAHCTFVSPSE
jgi:hypothetical protein